VSLPSASEIRENIEVEVERSCGIDQHETIMPDLAIALKDKESDLSHSLNPDDYQAQNDSSVDSAVDEMEVMSPSDELSPKLDTTTYEMMLYEKFGENYDERVEAMSKEERVELKRQLQNRGDDEIQQVAENLHKIINERSSFGSTMSPISLFDKFYNYQTASVVSPAKASLKPSRSLSKLPVPIPTTPRQVLGTPQSVSSTTPCSAKKASRVDDKRAAFAAVQSPVAEYVKSNPVPPLIQNVKGKSVKDLESTFVEVEDKENSRRLSQLPPCPLPAAVYQPGTVAEENIEYETGPEYPYIPEAYGTTNSSLKVTKHVARIILQVNDESLQSTPSVASVIQRDSGLIDENMLLG